MSKYLELPWSVDDTIEDLKELKEGIQKRLIIQNLHGRGEKDAEEIAFDFDRAIKALEEVQQYREIGTVEEYRASLEKQKEKKPKEYEDKFYGCPSCGNALLQKWEKYNTKLMDKKNGLPYCLSCGQRLDWSDEDE